MATNSSNNNSSNRSSTRRRTTASARTSRTKFYFNITINAFIGCMLAAIGTCLIFNGNEQVTTLAITIIGVFCVCLGAVAIVRYLRKNEGTSMSTLVIGILQAIVGVILIVLAPTVGFYVYLAIGIALIAYGIWTIIQAVRHGNTFTLIMGILLIVVGILVLLFAFAASWAWLQEWGYIIVGIAAYIGAVIFLFF